MAWFEKLQENAPTLFSELKRSRAFAVPEERNFVAPRSPHEKPPIEDEVVVLDVNKVKPDLVESLVHRGGTVVFDGNVTDYYFDIRSGDVKTYPMVQDWPRIRHKLHVDGRETYEFTQKGVRSTTESGGSKSGEFTEVCSSYEEADAAMRSYLASCGLDSTTIASLYAWNVFSKHRTSIELENVAVDVDTWIRREIVLDETAPTPITAKQTFNTPDADVQIPTYAEFEVIYDDPEGDPEKQSIANAKIQERDALMAELGVQSSKIGTGVIESHYGGKPSWQIRDEYRKQKIENAA
ncbi:MAG: hypothetical protein AAB439_01990 [Patescibacteria group bacterium]